MRIAIIAITARIATIERHKRIVEAQGDGAATKTQTKTF